MKKNWLLYNAVVFFCAVNRLWNPHIVIEDCAKRNISLWGLLKLWTSASQLRLTFMTLWLTDVLVCLHETHGRHGTVLSLCSFDLGKGIWAHRHVGVGLTLCLVLIHSTVHKKGLNSGQISHTVSLSLNVVSCSLTGVLYCREAYWTGVKTQLKYECLLLFVVFLLFKLYRTWVVHLLLLTWGYDSKWDLCTISAWVQSLSLAA